ncbi:MAG: hypothetical protein AVDCRST_MAG76-3618, partial [uncultured Acidimicrobiales bacterium]
EPADEPRAEASPAAPRVRRCRWRAGTAGSPPARRQGAGADQDLTGAVRPRGPLGARQGGLADEVRDAQLLARGVHRPRPSHQWHLRPRLPVGQGCPLPLQV